MFFGLQAPVVVSLGTAIGYAVLLIWVVVRRDWNTWHLRALLLYLALSIMLSVSLSLTLWIGLRAEAPSLGARLVADLLTGL